MNIRQYLRHHFDPAKLPKDQNKQGPWTITSRKRVRCTARGTIYISGSTDYQW